MSLRAKRGNPLLGPPAWSSKRQTVKTTSANKFFLEKELCENADKMYREHLIPSTTGRPCAGVWNMPLGEGELLDGGVLALLYSHQL